MTFPLYRRPGAVVFLDDDLDYLEMLADVMPTAWCVRLMMRPVACIEMLVGETASVELDMWRQQEIINRWREGASLIPQILAYWHDNGTSRFSMTRVCVVDYSMPAMSGLKVLSELTQWPGSRILLTGRADEQLAVLAFNSGSIQQFIPKQTPEIRLRLTDAIQSLLRKPDARHEQTWRATLSREQSALLSDITIAVALETLATQQNWVEHVVIGSPFGVLALTNTAKVTWLQLEPVNRLVELAEIAESQHCSAKAVQQVRSGKKLIDAELQLALGSGQKPMLQEAFVIGSETAQLHAAMFEVNEVYCPEPTDSHQDFIASQSQRPIQV
jgi:CheY-like chemotaxis protein